MDQLKIVDEKQKKKVLRAIDKYDKPGFGLKGVEELLKKERRDASGAVTIGANLSDNQAKEIIDFLKIKDLKDLSKKIDNRALVIFHKKIKKNSLVKISNPVNDKSIIAKVISNNVQFSDFYNSVITKRIANELSIDLNETEFSSLKTVGGSMVTGSIDFDKSGLLLFRKSQEDLIVFSRRCPHAGTSINGFNNGSAACPSHGAKFKTDGTPISGGPTNAPLKQYTVDLNGSIAIIYK